MDSLVICLQCPKELHDAARTRGYCDACHWDRMHQEALDMDARRRSLVAKCKPFPVWVLDEETGYPVLVSLQMVIEMRRG